MFLLSIWVLRGLCPSFYRHVGRIAFVVAFLCVVHVNACRPEMNPCDPKRKRIASLLKSGVEKLNTLHCGCFGVFWRAEGTKRRQKSVCHACFFPIFPQRHQSPRTVPERLCSSLQLSLLWYIGLYRGPIGVLDCRMRPARHHFSHASVLYLNPTVCRPSQT